MNAKQVNTRRPLDYSPRRLALTGATGSLGRHFLERILHDLPEVQVTALVRTSSANFRSPEFQGLLAAHPDRVTIVDADLRDPRITPQERRQLVEADGGLWHFAASTNLHAASPAAHQQIRDINEGGTFGILKMLGGSERPGPFYYVSTAYVCGKRVGRILETELDATPGFRNTYEASKHAAETRVRAELNSGLLGAIFRPSLVVSEEPGTGPAHIADVLLSAFQVASQSRTPLTLRIPPTASINAVDDRWTIQALLALAPFVKERKTYHLTARQDVTIGHFVGVASLFFEGLDVRLLPRESPVGTKVSDRLTDRLMTPFKPYFEGQVQFDRTNLENDAPELTEGAELDPLPLLRARTGQVAERHSA